MAMKRFPITNVEGDLVAQYRNPEEQLYASIELNQVAFPKTGMVVSQTPLGPKFVKSGVENCYGVCENGMWVVADKAKGIIDAPAAVTDTPIGVIYTTEKEYDREHYGLQRFGRKIAGDYPRVGIFGLGDTVTTNCLQYDDSEFQAVTTGNNQMTSEEVLLAELKKDLTANPLYVAIKAVGENETVSAANAVPQIVKSAPQAGIYGKIVKFYTIPNGGIGVKYQIIRL